MEATWFKDRLIELRMGKGLSRKELAARAGLQSEAGIRNLEQGRRMPSWEMVVALCKALGVGCDAFLQEPSGACQTRAGRPRKEEPTKRLRGHGGGHARTPAAKPSGQKGKKRKE